MIENDTRIAMILTSDQTVHERVSKSATEAAAIANEHERKRREHEQ